MDWLFGQAAEPRIGPQQATHTIKGNEWGWTFWPKVNSLLFKVLSLSELEMGMLPHLCMWGALLV